jgi:hypothetical protein
MAFGDLNKERGQGEETDTDQDFSEEDAAARPVCSSHDGF